MNNELKNGFSLTEVLLAVGILAVGMIFIAGVFPVAIHFTTVATERTIAAIAADEAFAKIKLYGGINTTWLSALSSTTCVDFNDVLPPAVDVNESDFVYPSTDADISQKQYCWSALCRLTASSSVQVTVFVCRKTGPHLKYYGPKDSSGEVNWPTPDKVDWPRPVKVEVDQPGPGDELRIKKSDEKTFLNDGYMLVDDRTGRMYRVLERYSPPDEDTILLDRDWDDSDPGGPPKKLWVVSPPVGCGRGPCLTIYQKVIQF